MRIACLQFAPQVGDVSNNLNRADAVLNRSGVKDIDLLVLPELAFTGYNFRSLQHISPFLEPTSAGITSLWARTTALKLNCFVVAGYPEKVDITPKWPANPEYYNAAIMVNRDGETVAHYRKTFLYYTDETWALEGPAGFYGEPVEGLGNVAMGICMDLNPYKFEAPWTAWEFARHVLHREANLVILSMAWLTREEARSHSRTPKEPDMETLSYWLARLEPIIREEGEEEIIAVFANRTGVEEEAVYAGTSAVLGIQAGEVRVYGILGRGENQLLVVDTSQRPQMQLVSEPKEQVVTETATKQKPDLRCTTSSAATMDTSKNQVSEVSHATSDTSVEPCIIPALENCTLTPVSPADHPSPQVYFRNSLIIENAIDVPSIESVTEPPAVTNRFTTPSPYSSTFQDIDSPVSRNESRSHGPILPHEIEEPISRNDSRSRGPKAFYDPEGPISRNENRSRGPKLLADESTISRNSNRSRGVKRVDFDFPPVNGTSQLSNGHSESVIEDDLSSERYATPSPRSSIFRDVDSPVSRNSNPSRGRRRERSPDEYEPQVNGNQSHMYKQESHIKSHEEEDDEIGSDLDPDEIIAIEEGPIRMGSVQTWPSSTPLVTSPYHKASIPKSRMCPGASGAESLEPMSEHHSPRPKSAVW